MRVITSITTMQRLAGQWRRRGARIGLVPTMGCLHEGHLSLMRVARRHIGRRGIVVVSIYVNPTQFAPQEDFSRYPRDLKRDLKLCRAEGVDTVFCPRDNEMYRDKTEGKFTTYVVEEELSRSMEGASRPGHFRGVTTVVAKLFNIVLPDVAVFGAKDWQQAAIIKRMVADLNFPLRIVVAPIVREPDGVAMSSRNKYLEPAQRAQAIILRRAIQHAQIVVRQKTRPARRLKKQLRQFISMAALARLDYVEIFNPETLRPVGQAKHGDHLAVAVCFGQTRLIDNSRL